MPPPEQAPRTRLSDMSHPTSPVYENLFHRSAAVALDVVVVGGSLAGLSTAYNLSQAGHNVRVLEKLDGEMKVSTGVRMPPNMAKLLMHWGIGDKLQEKSVKVPKIDFINGSTGAAQCSIIYHQELMKELQADVHSMLYIDLYEMIRDLAIKSGVKIEYNSVVVDVDVEGPSVLLEGGERVHADIVVGADGPRSLCREKVLGYKEDFALGFSHAFSYLIPVSKMKEDPILRSLVEDGTWSLWTGSLHCALNYLASPEYYCVYFHKNYTTGKKSGWVETTPLSELDLSEFEERIQHLVALGDRAVEAQHIMQDPMESWYSDNGKVVLVGNAVHASDPASSNDSALAVEDGAVLGSLFSRLQANDSDEILRLLGAYQEIRQDRCITTITTDMELVKFCTLPPGPERDGRDAGFATMSSQQALDWDDADEEILRGAWEEFRKTFGYEAYDAADDWWVDWGVLVHRLAAAHTVADDDEEDDNPMQGFMSRRQTVIQTSILDCLQTQTVVTTVES